MVFNLSNTTNISTFIVQNATDSTPATVAPGTASLVAVCIFAITGLTINIVSFAAILHARPLESPLRLLLSLSCADMLTDFAYIAQLLLSNVAPRGIHTFFLTGFFLVSSLLSVFFNVIAMTLERYICIIYPLRYHAIVNEKRVTIGIAVLWICAICVGAICGSIFVVNPKNGGSISNIVLVSIVGVPIIAMGILYVRVGFELRKLRKQPGATTTSTTKGAVTALLIMGTFIVCCIPPSLFIIILEAKPSLFMNSSVSIFEMYNGFACLNLTNTIFDPCIYGFRNARVISGFKRMVNKCRCSRKDQVMPM